MVLAVLLSLFLSAKINSPDSSGQSVAPQLTTSVAQRVAPADTPLNLVETPDGFLISTNSGYGAHYLQAYDERREEVTGRIELPSLWYGLDYSPSHKSVLASTGAHSVLLIPFQQGKFGKPREFAFERCELTAGIAIQSQTAAVVLCNRSYEAIRFNLLTGKILQRVRVGEFPYSVKVLPGNRLAVANWGQASVSILDGKDIRTLRTILVGSHPTDELALPSRRQLLVACSDADLVSVIDLESLQEVRRLKIAIPNSQVGGGQPNALALNPMAGKLFVALAAVNALAMLDLKQIDGEPKLDCLVPVGAYPTALLYSSRAHKLYIADGRNLVTGPSSPRKAASSSNGGATHPVEPRRGPTPSTLPAHAHKTDSGQRTDYIGYLLGGGIEALADADLRTPVARGRTLAQQVYGEAPRELDAGERELVRYFSVKNNPQSPIRHVIYVIKENRTYDQVLGDMPEGNGAPDLVLFGESVTPNHHALVRQFVLFDSFYVDGDVSADGHVWSTAASSTDYVNKLWPSFYARRLKYDFVGPDYDGDDGHDQPLAIPKSGAIWDVAQKSGVSYRDYGEWCVDEVEHAHFSTASVLRTIEQILALPSLTYFDDRAPSLLVDFQHQSVLDRYTALRPQVPLDEVNPPNAPGAHESARWDFSRPDRAPEQELNRVIWKSVKGANSEPPPSILTAR